MSGWAPQQRQEVQDADSEDFDMGGSLDTSAQSLNDPGSTEMQLNLQAIAGNQQLPIPRYLPQTLAQPDAAFEVGNLDGTRSVVYGVHPWIPDSSSQIAEYESRSSTDPTSLLTYSSTSTSIDGSGTRRITKACARCRKRKTKCSGEPICSACAVQNKTCVYPDNKIELEKARIEAIERENFELKRIFAAQTSRDAPQSSPGPSGTSDRYPTHHVSRRNHFASARATTSTSSSSPLSAATNDTSDANDSKISPWPEPRRVELMLSTFLDHVHTSFPVLDSERWVARIRSLQDVSLRSAPQRKARTLRIANAVFALAAQYNHYSKQSGVNVSTDHDLYHTRSKPTDFNNWDLFEDADEESVVYLGLLGLYYVNGGRLERARAIVAVAIRHATAMGLHKSDMGGKSSHQHEEEPGRRVMMWWSLCSLECQICVITQLPSCIRLGDYLIDSSQTLSAFFQRQRRQSADQKSRGKHVEDDPRHDKGHWLIAHTGFNMIAHELCFRPQTLSGQPDSSSMESHTINSDHERKLRDWFSILPPELSPLSSDGSEHWTKVQICLALTYHSTRMLLYHHPDSPIGNAARERDFIEHGDVPAALDAVQNQTLNAQSIESARAVITILMELQDKKSIYQLPANRYAIVALMQACEIIMVSMGHQPQNRLGSIQSILNDDVPLQAYEWLSSIASGYPPASELSHGFGAALNR